MSKLKLKTNIFAIILLVSCFILISSGKPEVRQDTWFSPKGMSDVQTEQLVSKLQLDRSPKKTKPRTIAESLQLTKTSEAKTTQGLLSIIVQPEDSKIYMDDYLISTGEIKLMPVEEGKHTISVRNEGYIASLRSVVIGSKKETILRLSLLPLNEVFGEYYRRNGKFVKLRMKDEEYLDGVECLVISENRDCYVKLLCSPCYKPSQYMDTYYTKGKIRFTDDGIALNYIPAFYFKIHISSDSCAIFRYRQISKEKTLVEVKAKEKWRKFRTEVDSYQLFPVVCKLTAHRYGDKTYLLEPSQYRAFMEAILSGEEPRQSPFGNFYMKSQKEITPEEWLPNPEQEMQKFIEDCIQSKDKHSNEVDRKTVEQLLDG